MYIITIAILIVIVGAVEVLMSIPIGMTHAAVDGNFASKAVMNGGLTRTAAIVAVPKMAGINPFEIEFKHYSTGIEINGTLRRHGYQVKIDSIGLSEEQATIRFPYALPIYNFYPETGPIKSGEVAVIYFHNVRWIGAYDTAAVLPYPNGVKGPFGTTIDFRHVRS